ncbi:MAG: DUF3052 domain-containing protein [Cyclobacteriaceae bacterium]|nr:DUF3052 domain-containing protein [Cyclobacteriaceae bacterium]
MVLYCKGEPAAYWDWLAPLPQSVKLVKRPTTQSLDFIHIFVLSRLEFESAFKKLKPALNKQGLLWVSWPKKSSGVKTDLDENIIRAFGLAAGLVDVKVCAVDETWSGLKFVYRLQDR